MTIPFDLVVRDMNLPEGVAEDIRGRAEKLGQFHHGILRCRVKVEGAGPHHRQGRCKVSIQIAIPGDDIRIDRQKGEDLAEALREAFSAAERRLEDHVRVRRGDVKRHERSSGG